MVATGDTKSLDHGHVAANLQSPLLLSLSYNPKESLNIIYIIDLNHQP